MDFNSKLNTTFSPRTRSVSEFLNMLIQTLPKQDIFLISLPENSEYYTTVFPLENTVNRWCRSPDGKVSIILDKSLIFQTGDNTAMYTCDGKVFRQVDDQKIVYWYTRYTNLWI